MLADNELYYNTEILRAECFNLVFRQLRKLKMITDETVFAVFSLCCIRFIEIPMQYQFRAGEFYFHSIFLLDSKTNYNILQPVHLNSWQHLVKDSIISLRST